jgi:hypothetical protein
LSSEIDFSKIHSLSDLKKTFDDLLHRLLLIVSDDHLQTRADGTKVPLSEEADTIRFVKTLGHEGHEILFNNEVFQLYYQERGSRNLLLESSKAEEILYFVFKTITQSLAVQFELNNRDSQFDSRRVWFKIQENLIGHLNSEWSRRLSEHHAQLLDKNKVGE